MPGKLVFDTSPLIHLASVELLQLPVMLGNRCFVPKAVLQELEQGSRKDAQPIVGLLVGSYEKLPSIQIPPVVDHPALGDGEEEVLAQCLVDESTVAVIDDLYSRRIAMKLGLQTTGVLGILLDAHAEGHIQSMEQVAWNKYFAP